MASATEAPKYTYVPKGDPRSPATVKAIHQHLFPQVENFISGISHDETIGDLLGPEEHAWIRDARKILKQTGGVGEISRPKDSYSILGGFLEWHTVYVASSHETEKAT